MNDDLQGHGYIKEPQEEDHFVLGSQQLPRVILQPTGNWQEHLPPGEPQSRPDLETCNCTAYNTLSSIEILIRRLFGTQPDFSERFVGIMAGTRPPGNSPHTACEAIRRYGLIEESLLPFNDSIHSILEYYSPDPMTEELLARGQEWLSFFDFGHEWVWADGSDLPTKQSALKEALKYSPVSLSTYAWVWNAQGIYIKAHGLTDNHWTTCVDYKEGEYWLILDSYDPFLKKVAWDTDFTQAKRFHLAKKDPVVEAKKFSILTKLVEVLTQYVPLVIQTLFTRTYPTEMNPTKLQFCKAIQEYEGWYPPSKEHPMGSRSFRNKNPGNLKFAGQKGATGKDDKGFAIFPTEEMGLEALIRLVELVISGKSAHYTPTMNLNQFFGVYAPTSDNNAPSVYAAFVGRKIGVNPAVFRINQLS